MRSSTVTPKSKFFIFNLAAGPTLGSKVFRAFILDWAFFLDSSLLVPFSTFLVGLDTSTFNSSSESVKDMEDPD